MYRRGVMYIHVLVQVARCSSLNSRRRLLTIFLRVNIYTARRGRRENTYSGYPAVTKLFLYTWQFETLGELQKTGSNEFFLACL